MANLDPFTSQIVEYVRNMPDEALLELVRAHLGGSGVVQLPSSGGPVRTRAKARVASSPAPTKRASATRKPAKRKGKRATSAQRQQPLDTVEKLVKKSKGMSASDVAKKANAPQTRVASALRELKANKKIYQGGERRFARYAGDVQTANKASVRARKTASGPVRK